MTVNMKGGDGAVGCKDEKRKTDSTSTNKGKGGKNHALSRKSRAMAVSCPSSPIAAYKNGIKIFTKSSPDFQEFLELIKRKGWRHKLPSTKKDEDLSSFMEMTGYTRAQVTRKFNEYVRALDWTEAQTKKMSKEPSLNEQHAKITALSLVDVKDECPEEEQNPGEQLGPIKKEQPEADVAEDRTGLFKSLPKQSKPFSSSPLGKNDVWSEDTSSKKQKLHHEFPLIPSPPQALRQISSSALSPLRTKKFHEIAPPSYRVTLMEPVDSPLLNPPELMRIQTAEAEQLLKGQLMQDPDHEHQSDGQDPTWFQNDSQNCSILQEDKGTNDGQDGHFRIHGLGQSSDSSDPKLLSYVPQRKNSFVYQITPESNDGHDAFLYDT